jgi:exopolyphosphatase/guanosine-5'-triphosphate,3'-diphosphate pyrophosphatase
MAQAAFNRSGMTRGRRALGPTYAAVDLGSNNCRLLVAEPSPRGFRVVDAFSRIVRLGEGVAASGALSEDAIARTIDALGVCASKIRRHRTLRARHVATEACRKAANCRYFVDRVEAATGLRLEIISVAEEARLAIAGCAPLLDRRVPNALIIDIGGGSSEVIWRHGTAGRGGAEVGILSLPLGVVSFTEKFGGDHFTLELYEAMVDEVHARLAPFEAEHGIAEAARAGTVQMVGTSGTVTTLASVHLGLRRYVRSRVDGCTIRFADIARISRELAALDFAGRARIGCIGPERADLVVAGAAILEAICRKWPVGRMRVADRGLREGILLGLMAQDGHGARPLGAPPCAPKPVADGPRVAL